MPGQTYFHSPATAHLFADQSRLVPASNHAYATLASLRGHMAVFKHEILTASANAQQLTGRLLHCIQGAERELSELGRIISQSYTAGQSRYLSVSPEPAFRLFRQDQTAPGQTASLGRFACPGGTRPLPTGMGSFPPSYLALRAANSGLRFPDRRADAVTVEWSRRVNQNQPPRNEEAAPMSFVREDEDESDESKKEDERNESESERREDDMVIVENQDLHPRLRRSGRLEEAARAGGR